MMISAASSKNHQPGPARQNSLLVLEPPRHSKLPLAFLGPGKHLIGTNDACAIRIVADGVHQHHAMILVGEQKVLLKALDPRTWVNDSAVSETAIRSGDRVSIGPITFRVRYATADELRNRASLSVDDRAPTELARSQPLARLPEPELPGVRSQLEKLAESIEIVEPVKVPMVGLSVPQLEVPTLELPAVEVPQLEARQLDNPQLDIAEFVVPLIGVPQFDVPRVDVSTLEAISPDVLRVEPLTEPAALSELLSGASAKPERPGHTSMSAISRQELEAEFAAEAERRFAARECESKRIADEIARQSQQLQERAARADEREAEVVRKQALIAAEDERRNRKAEATRRELADQYTRQTTLWQEREAAHCRSTEELKAQLLVIEQQRAELHVENERAARERIEIQRLRHECDREQRAVEAERSRTNTDIENLLAERTAFEAERQQQLAALQEREAQLESERRSVAIADEELLASRQQLEQERTQIAAERSSESMRREQEIREYSAARLRLSEDETAAQTTRFELEAARNTLEDHRGELKREREAFDSQRVELENRRALLNQAEIELNIKRQSDHDARSVVERAEENIRGRQNELDEWQRTLESRQVQLDSVPAVRPYYETKSLSTQLTSPVPPPIPATAPVTAPMVDWNLSGIQERPSMGALDRSLPSNQIGLGPSIAMSVRGVNSDSGAFLDASTFAPASALDVADEIPMPDVQQEFAISGFASAVMEAPCVDQTLSDVNQRFGYRPTFAGENPAPAQSLESFGESPVIGFDGEIPESRSGLVSDEISTTSLASKLAASEKEDPLSSLRAQLAQMFDLPENAKSFREVSSETNVVDPVQDPTDLASNERNFTDLIEPNVVEESLIDSQADDSSLVTLTSDSAEPSVTMSDDLPANIENSAVAADANSVDAEDAWTRRLRELSQAAGVVESPPPPDVPSMPVAKEPESAEEDDEEYSVEAQLARLLGRPQRGGGPSNEVPKPSQTDKAPKEIAGRDSSEAVTLSATVLPSTDRSHMTEEPRHRQNKNAVREEVQSFREVAQMSARGALATHSWNNLRSEIYFKAALGTVSAAATVWFVGGFAYGSETESWKGITCALTSLVCTKSLFSSSSKMKLWRKKNKAPPAARKTSAASVDDVSAAAPNSQSSQEITSARRASEGSSHSPPTRTADQ